MDDIVVAIAESRADLLHRLSNWERYSTFDGSYDPRTFNGELEPVEQEDVRLEKMTAEAAVARARATNREFGVVLREVEMEVAIQLGRILARPAEEVAEGVLAGSVAVAVAVEEGLVCGVCQEEMGGKVREVVGCGHKFHEECILEWLKRKRTCPLCRFQLQDQD